jgi:hypothetical protein
MAGAGAKYSRTDASDEPSQDSNRVRAEAARRCVRHLHRHAILSGDWMSVVESVEQLARLAQLEELLPADAKVADVRGRNAGSGGTLWDQEAQENTIRILVEEAKVNLCVRLMNEYKVWFYNVPERRRQIEALSSRYTEAQIERKCAQFEQSLGLVLLRSFLHIETLQLTDIPLLLEHIHLVLQGCKDLDLPQPDNTKLQETVVLHYFSAVMKHAEAMNNSEIMARVRELRLVPLVTDHMLRYSAEYPMIVLCVVVDGLASLADNEDFKTEWESFFDAAGSEVDPKVSFVQLEELVLGRVLEAYSEKRAETRPLKDLFARIKRATR